MGSMKKPIVWTLSLGVLVGAYGIAFGVPEQITQFWASPPTEDTAAPRGGDRGARGQSSATTVVLAPLEARSYTLVLRTIGSAVSLYSADVIAAEAGEVVEIALEANALVEKGDTLLRLDDRTEQLALESARAHRDQAQDTVTRYKGLQKNSNAVVTDVALAEAEVELRLAEADVGLAEIALENRTIVAPISGRLGLSDINVGDWLSAGEAIVSVDDSTTLLATFEVPERSIGLLAKGKPVLVTTPTYTGRLFEGTITAFDSRLDSVTRSATVQAEIDNSEGDLLAGMTLVIRLSNETDPLPMVPSTAITWDRSGAGMWVSEEGQARRVPVTILYRNGDRVWIEADVAVGAQIVTEGASKLREGAQVETARSDADSDA